MSEWTAVLQRIKAVKRAREEFLFRDYVNQNIIGPLLLDRVAADLWGSGEAANGSKEYSAQTSHPVADDR